MAFVQFRLARNLTRDLFGIFDILAVSDVHKRTLAIQCTTYTHVDKRVEKMLAAKNVLEDCASSGWEMEVWGWRKPTFTTTRAYWEVRKLRARKVRGKWRFEEYHNGRP